MEVDSADVNDEPVEKANGGKSYEEFFAERCVIISTFFVGFLCFCFQVNFFLKLVIDEFALCASFHSGITSDEFPNFVFIAVRKFSGGRM